jgi:hypothetical protein
MNTYKQILLIIALMISFQGHSQLNIQAGIGVGVVKGTVAEYHWHNHNTISYKGDIIKNDVTRFNVCAEYIFEKWLVGLDLGIDKYDMDFSITQITRSVLLSQLYYSYEQLDYSSNIYTARSDIYFGYQFPLNNNSSLLTSVSLGIFKSFHEKIKYTSFENEYSNYKQYPSGIFTLSLAYRHVFNDKYHITGNVGYSPFKKHSPRSIIEHSDFFFGGVRLGYFFKQRNK